MRARSGFYRPMSGLRKYPGAIVGRVDVEPGELGDRERLNRLKRRDPLNRLIFVAVETLRFHAKSPDSMLGVDM